MSWFITTRRTYGRAVRGHGGPVAAVPVGVGTGVGVGAGPGDGVAAGGDDIPPVSFTRARGVVCGRAIRVVVAVTTVRTAGCATAGGVGSRDTGAVVTLVRARAAGGEEEFVRRGDSVTVAGAEDDVVVGAVVAEGVGGMGVGVGLVVAGQALTGVGTRGDVRVTGAMASAKMCSSGRFCPCPPGPAARRAGRRSAVTHLRVFNPTIASYRRVGGCRLDPRARLL